jgi:putative transposase
MARGDRREEIFRDERDRWKFLGYLAEGAERYRVKVHCYVLMENHFHLVATTPEGNLSKWMHQLKTAYTVYFNRRHQVVGHLFPDDSANQCPRRRNFESFKESNKS